MLFRTRSLVSAALLVAALGSVTHLVPTVPAAAEDASKELVFIFQKQKDPNEVKAAADKVAAYLSNALGRTVRAQVPGDYSASVQALISKKADFAYVSSLPFLLARRDGEAELLLAEELIDPRGKPRTEYDSVLVVSKDSPLKTVDDLVQQASALRMVFTSPTSTSGYVFAYSRFVDENLLKPKQDPNTAFKSVQFGGSYTQAVEQVLSGRGDVAAVSYYVVEGPRASTYLTDEQRSKLRILARTPGVPTHLIAARAGLDPELKDKVAQALLKMSSEHPELLEDVYGTAKFVEVDENKHIGKTVEAVTRIGLPIDGLV